MLPEPLLVVRRMAQIFEALGIPYLVGGSIASSTYGLSRATQDVDFVAEIRTEQIPALVAAMEEEFYIDADMVRDAIANISSFNVIHLPTMVKGDVFLRERNEWVSSEWERRRPQRLGTEDDTFTVFLATPEDRILQKLRRYRFTGERSDQQWGDVLGMIKVQNRALDDSYLRLWATRLGLADLLDIALTEAGVPGGSA